MKSLCSSLLLVAGLAALPHAWAEEPAGEAGEKPVWAFTPESVSGDWQYGTQQGWISDGNWKFRVSRTNVQYSRDFYLRSPSYQSEVNKSGTYLEGSGSVLDFSTLERWYIGGSQVPGGEPYCGSINMNSIPGTTNRDDQAEIDVKFRGDIKKIVFPSILKGGDGNTLPKWFNCFNTTAPFPNVEEVDFSLCTELTALPSRFFYQCPELKTVRLPATVKGVHKNGAFNAPKLTAIYWDGPAPAFTGDSDIGYLWNSANNTTNYVSRQYAESWKALCDENYPLDEGKVGQLMVDYAGKGAYAIPKKVYVAFADEGGFALALEDWTGPYDGEPHGAVFSVNPPDATVTWAVGESQDYSDEMPTLTEVGSLSVRARAAKEGEEPIEKIATITVTIGENSWVIEPSLSKLSWKVGEEAPALTLGRAKFGTPTANYTQATLPTEVGSYVLEVTVPASDNWTALTKSIPFAITDKPVWTFTSTGNLQGTITDGNWLFEVNNTNGGDTRWNLKTYLAGVGDLDMSTLERWTGCSWMYMDNVKDGEGVAISFENAVTKVTFPSFLGAQVWSNGMVPGRQPGWFNCQSGVHFPNVKEADFSLCEELIKLPQFCTQNHPALTTIRLPAVLDSVPDYAFNGKVLTDIYWMGAAPASMSTKAYKWENQTNFVLRANAESWAAKCVVDEPLAEKKVGRLSPDYVGTHSAYGKTSDNMIYVVFTPFKEKKGFVIFVR